jgi:hypothetical protein
VQVCSQVACGLIPPTCHQPVALVRWHVVFLDRLLDRGLLVRLIIDDTNELGWRPADVVDGPGMIAVLLDRSLRHCYGTIVREARGAGLKASLVTVIIGY